MSHRTGQLMSYWILPPSGIVISCTTVQRLTHSEMQTDEWKERMSKFNEGITGKLEAASAMDHPIPNKDTANGFDLDDEDPEFIEEFHRVISDESIVDTDVTEALHWTNYPYISMEIGMP